MFQGRLVGSRDLNFSVICAEVVVTAECMEEFTERGYTGPEAQRW